MPSIETFPLEINARILANAHPYLIVRLKRVSKAFKSIVESVTGHVHFVRENLLTVKSRPFPLTVIPKTSTWTDEEDNNYELLNNGKTLDHDDWTTINIGTSKGSKAHTRMGVDWSLLPTTYLAAQLSLEKSWMLSRDWQCESGHYLQKLCDAHRVQIVHALEILEQQDVSHFRKRHPPKDWTGLRFIVGSDLASMAFITALESERHLKAFLENLTEVYRNKEPTDSLSRTIAEAFQYLTRRSKPSLVKAMLDWDGIETLQSNGEVVWIRAAFASTYGRTDAFSRVRDVGTIETILASFLWKEPNSFDIQFDRIAENISEEMGERPEEATLLLLSQPSVPVSTRMLGVAIQQGRVEVALRLIRDIRTPPYDFIFRHHIQLVTAPRIIEELTKTEWFDVAGDNNRLIRSVQDGKVAEFLLSFPNVDPSACDNQLVRTTRDIGVLKAILKDKRVDPSAVDNNALRRACFLKNADMAFALVTHPRIVDPWFDAGIIFRLFCEKGHAEGVNWMLTNGPAEGHLDPTEYDNDALKKAVAGGHVDITRILFGLPALSDPQSKYPVPVRGKSIASGPVVASVVPGPIMASSVPPPPPPPLPVTLDDPAIFPASMANEFPPWTKILNSALTAPESGKMLELVLEYVPVEFLVNDEFVSKFVLGAYSQMKAGASGNLVKTLLDLKQPRLSQFAVGSTFIACPDSVLALQGLLSLMEDERVQKYVTENLVTDSDRFGRWIMGICRSGHPEVLIKVLVRWHDDCLRMASSREDWFPNIVHAAAERFLLNPALDGGRAGNDFEVSEFCTLSLVLEHPAFGEWADHKWRASEDVLLMCMKQAAENGELKLLEDLVRLLDKLASAEVSRKALGECLVLSASQRRLESFHFLLSTLRQVPEELQRRLTFFEDSLPATYHELALRFACIKGDVEMARIILDEDRGSVIEGPLDGKISAHFSRLAQSNASVNDDVFLRMSAFALASLKSQKDVMRLLCEKIPETCQLTEEGSAKIVLAACMTGSPDSVSVALAELNIDLREKRNMFIFIEGLRKAWREGFAELVEFFLLARIDRDGQLYSDYLEETLELLPDDNNGMAADKLHGLLLRSCERNLIHLCRLLLKHPHVDPTKNHNMCLIKAIKNGNSSIVSILLTEEKRIDPGAYGNSAMRVAFAVAHCDSTVKSGWTLFKKASTSCSIVHLLLADSRVDPSYNNNESLRCAISHIVSADKHLIYERNNLKVVDTAIEKYRMMEQKCWVELVGTIMKHRRLDLTRGDRPGSFGSVGRWALFHLCEQGNTAGLIAFLGSSKVFLVGEMGIDPAAVEGCCLISTADMRYCLQGRRFSRTSRTLNVLNRKMATHLASMVL
ncbi:hypothetical protein HDU97_000789 [Phlyctochytrium planicorne]|nr:hypothetical protein HDU97_000789 [Phlyctochytrium planicorne]